VSPEHSAKICDIKLEAFLPSDLNCEITTLLFDEEHHLERDNWSLEQIA
jgi:hypothetical protein